jgi:methylmalonyl-CoA/ethylmalonyl-CoA epimerase
MPKSKGYLRHVALSVADPWETAEFYKEIAGLEEVAEIDGELAEGVFLTDGVCNLALLKFKTDEAAQGTGKDFVGIHHIGFWVDDVIESGKMSRAAGARWIMGDPNNPDGYEVKHLDLSGIIYDIAAHGWAGSQKRPGEPENIGHVNPNRRLAKFDERREAARRKIAAKKAEMAANGDPLAQGRAAE